MLTFNRIMQRNRGSAISSRFLILINLIDPIYSINYQSGLSLPPKNGLVTKYRCLSLVSLSSLLFALCCPGLRLHSPRLPSFVAVLLRRVDRKTGRPLSWRNNWWLV